MPKSLKKSCTTKTSISSYFRVVSSSHDSSTRCGINQKPAEQQLTRGKQKPSSDDDDGGDFGLPPKRAKLSLQHQHVEELDCEPASCQSTKETTRTSSRGAGGLCSSTLEKLKSFTCFG
ncbi:hypothetical protein L3Q82_006894 [Scortum barcoo]|uniref:Uncharacterized protein n=1 Tax=Scortum barcoo TaxID=214431 RepID=A0ACB8WWZ0_9TELE|nr:hypothetical protein L3Q82_006894 [Scortum barcoo]